MTDPRRDEMKTAYQENTKDMAEAKISIAVLLSTYNGEKYLGQQIESILSQRFEDVPSLRDRVDLQLYIRDDGSSDSTKSVLQGYKNRDDVHVFLGENKGITESYFELIRLAGAQDYYSMSDQDDVWLSDKLESAIMALEEEKKKHEDSFPLLYGCRSYLVDVNLEKTGQMTQKQLRPLTICNTAIQNILLGHNQVFNAALARELLSKELDYSQIYAHDMWITQAASVTGKIIFENEPHTLYRQHGGNELGYGSGAGSLKWIIARIKRAGKGEGGLIGKQVKYFYSIYYDNLNNKEDFYLKRFVSEDNRWPKRFLYVFRSGLYRQRKSESIMFRILFVLGKYSKT